MDIKEYISSGVIEAYVLGLASDEEAKEVEANAVKYAEVKEAITSFEKALEKEISDNAVAPPPFVRENVMAAIQAESNQKPVGGTVAADSKPQPAKVIPMHTTAPKSIRWMRGAVAASVILLLGSVILNFYYYSQYKKYSGQYSNLLAQQSTLVAQNETYRANFQMMNDTAVVKVTMKAATPRKFGSVATVYWNKQTKDVFVTVNNLPRPAAGKQYQLWAIVDGVPVDAGMIKNDMIQKAAEAAKMNPKVNRAEAFAITLEKEGGSPTPNPDKEQLYVVGKV